MNLLRAVFQFFSSFGLAVVLLLLMLVVVFLGTMYQVDHGLFAAQEKYFNSFFVVHHFFDWLPMTLPGGYLLMSLFMVNIVLGGIVRIRKNKRTVGIIIGHLGVIVMIVGGAVTFHYSDSGNMQLYEGETSDEFESYYDWTIEVGRVGDSNLLHVIDERQFDDLGPGKRRTFTNPEWPFDVVVSNYAKNAWPVRERGGEGGMAIDGFRLEPLPLEKEAEMNLPGVYVTAVDKETGATTDGILWGMSLQPLTVEAGGADWAVGLARKRWKVPFQVTLDEFVRELHPGTDMPASFESFITKREAGKPDEKIHIYMNQPLRYHGYTFFQASWGPQNAGPDTRLFSVFAVVRNPADQWPLVACIIVGIGMTLHFGQRLYRYLRKETTRREAA
jgi:hypothetical protein